MFAFLRREVLYVLSGFIVTFVVYLFIQFDTSEVIQGLFIGLAGGIGVAVLLFILEHWVPGRSRRRRKVEVEV